YDTERAARTVTSLAPSLRADGITVKGVRLDSGDLADHARRVRRILDEGGLPHTQILASGNLDEYRVKDLLDSRAPVDGFAVGTAMTTSSDAPSLDSTYKLQDYAGRPCRKRSEGKATWPGRKQVFRSYAGDGCFDHDTITTEEDQLPGVPLLRTVMRDGRRLSQAPTLTDLRRHTAEQLARLPEPLRTLETAPTFPVLISQALQDLAQTVDRSLSHHEGDMI
ncbi:MAG: nicotinate phosphoribosyltransferase, partial [Nitrospira sp.]|nr:nicotinate phosphoribosyltransferase [Nitrospira sp.]